MLKADGKSGTLFFWSLSSASPADPRIRVGRTFQAKFILEVALNCVRHVPYFTASSKALDEGDRGTPPHTLKHRSEKRTRSSHIDRSEMNRVLRPIPLSLRQKLSTEFDYCRSCGWEWVGGI